MLQLKKKNDDKICRICKKNKVFYYRGKINDVLSRYYKAAQEHNLNTIIRCNSDCPFIDKQILKKMINKYKKEKYDYFSNILEPTFPSGLHTEILNFKTLKIAYKKMQFPKQIESMLHLIYIRVEKKFNIGSFKQKKIILFTGGLLIISKI